MAEFEEKLNSILGNQEAMAQINEKGYALPFEGDSRQLFKIGVNFSSKTRNIEKWIVEKRS